MKAPKLNKNFLLWLEPIKDTLVIAMFLWLFTVSGFLIWYLTEPELVSPASPALLRNKILTQGKAVPMPEPPKIENFNGSSNITKNIDKYDEFLRQAALKYRLNCTYIKAYMMAESQGKPKARSSSGALGLMQLMPSTARAMGYSSNLFDPKTSIMAGAKYILHLDNTACHEKPRNPVCDTAVDSRFQIAAYNGGSKCNKPAAAGNCSGLTMWECLWYDGYGQTRTYVNRVKANYNHLKKMDWGC